MSMYTQLVLYFVKFVLFILWIYYYVSMLAIGIQMQDGNIYNTN